MYSELNWRTFVCINLIFCHLKLLNATMFRGDSGENTPSYPLLVVIGELMGRSFGWDRIASHLSFGNAVEVCPNINERFSRGA